MITSGGWGGERITAVSPREFPSRCYAVTGELGACGQRIKTQRSVHYRGKTSVSFVIYVYEFLKDNLLPYSVQTPRVLVGLQLSIDKRILSLNIITKAKCNYITNKVRTT